jgi:ABC transporter substrate binding protein
MLRRAFLAFSLVLSFNSIYPACAADAPQARKVWRIGFLIASTRRAYDEVGSADAFVRSMRELGYVEGENLRIEWRYADGKYELLPNLAAELVRLNVDVIVAVPSPAIRATRDATTTIPIVFPGTGDPVGSGFAASLAHPGGNLTGLSNSNLDVSAKTLELLRGDQYENCQGTRAHHPAIAATAGGRGHSVISRAMSRCTTGSGWQASANNEVGGSIEEACDPIMRKPDL